MAWRETKHHQTQNCDHKAGILDVAVKVFRIVAQVFFDLLHTGRQSVARIARHHPSTRQSKIYLANRLTIAPPGVVPVLFPLGFSRILQKKYPLVIPSGP